MRKKNEKRFDLFQWVMEVVLSELGQCRMARAKEVKEIRAE